MDKKLYSSHFYMMGGYCGEAEYKLEAHFELTEEEVQQAIDALEETDNLNAELPEAMHDAIWEAALDQLYEDAAEYQLGDLDDIDERIPGWEDMTTKELVEAIRSDSALRSELFDMDSVEDLISKISYPEEVTPSE